MRKAHIMILAISLFCAAGAHGEAALSYPLEITDATEEVIRIDEVPASIVSLNPSATEVIVALGRQDLLAGVTSFCPFEDMKEEKKVIGTVLDPDIERIVAMDADLVIATVDGNRRAPVMHLREAGLNVLVLDRVKDFRGLYARIREVSRVCGAVREGERLIRSMSDRIGAVRSRVSAGPPRSVFLQMTAHPPLISVQRESILNEIIELAGGANIARDVPTRYPRFSYESVVAEDPDVIIIVDMGSDTEPSKRAWARFGGLTAVRTGAVYSIPADIVCNIGPRLVDGVEEMSRLIVEDDAAPVIAR